MTPRVNPFKCKSTPGVKDHADANRIPLFKLDSDEEGEHLPSCRTFDRRPSSLFKLAIMRDFDKKPESNSEAFKSASCDASERVKSSTGLTNLCGKKRLA